MSLYNLFLLTTIFLTGILIGSVTFFQIAG